MNTLIMNTLINKNSYDYEHHTNQLHCSHSWSVHSTTWWWEWDINTNNPWWLLLDSGDSEGWSLNKILIFFLIPIFSFCCWAFVWSRGKLHFIHWSSRVRKFQSLVKFRQTEDEWEGPINTIFGGCWSKISYAAWGPPHCPSGAGACTHCPAREAFSGEPRLHAVQAVVPVAGSDIRGGQRGLVRYHHVWKRLS